MQKQNGREVGLGTFPTQGTETPTNDGDTDDLLMELRSELCDWLTNSADDETERLQDWLQGYYLSAFGYTDEPYLLLLRALPQIDESYATETALARRAAHILAARPDVLRPGKRPEQLLYNLLMLCAGLGQPSELADPLYEVYERRALRGDWRGLELRAALGPALIYNQKDNRLEAEWQGLIQADRHEYLIGDREDGVEAVLLMPPSIEQQGEPALDAIGAALHAVTQQVEGQTQQVERHEERPASFLPFVNRVLSTYPGRPTWSADLIRMANGHYWPAWAVMCLPDLFVEAGEDRSTRHANEYYLWEIFLPILEDLKVSHAQVDYTIVEEMCKVTLPQTQKRVPLIYHVAVSDEALSYLMEIVPRVEDNRNNLPVREYRQVVGSANQAFIDLENAFSDNAQTSRQKPDLMRKAIRSGRYKLLTKRLNFKLPPALVNQPLSD
jgi:hypothetical protein